MTVVRHVMDDFADGDTAWLQRLNGFQQRETARQVHFKRHHWPQMIDGQDPDRPGETYPHVLPPGNEHKVFYPGHLDALLDYADREGLALDARLLNLCNSQAAALNVLFQFRQNRDWAGRVLEPLLPGLACVEQVHFEYAGGDEAVTWLGETADKWGDPIRTVADAAFEWIDADGAHRLTLVDWTYTEASLGECAAFKSETNPLKERCKNAAAAQIEPGIDCALEAGGERHYWEHLAESGADFGAFATVRGCPFRGALQRLMHLTLLAAGLRRERSADVVDVAVIAFQRNRSLLSTPRELKGMPGGEAGILDVWNSALLGALPVRLVLVERVMEAVDCADGTDADWRAYARERYGL